MKWNITNSQTRLYIISAITLLIGLGTSTIIYLTSGYVSESVLGSEPEISKMYTHDVELYGGNAMLLADDVTHWFAGLWQGESLAYTIGCITILISFWVFFVAYLSPFDVESGIQDKKIEAEQD